MGAKTGQQTSRSIPKLKTRPAINNFADCRKPLCIVGDTAARLGMQPQAVDSTLYSAFGQRQVSIIYTQQNQYHVILEVDPQYPPPTQVHWTKSTSNRIPALRCR